MRMHRPGFGLIVILAALIASPAIAQKQIEDFPPPKDNAERHRQILEMIERYQPSTSRSGDPDALAILRKLGPKFMGELTRMVDSGESPRPIDFDVLTDFGPGGSPQDVEIAKKALANLEKLGVFKDLDELARAPRAVRPKGDGLLLSKVVPETGWSRSLTRATLARMSEQLRAHDLVGAIASYEQALALGRTIAHQELMIDRMVAVSIVSRANLTLRQAIASDQLDDGALLLAQGAMIRQLLDWPPITLHLDAEQLATIDAAEFVYEQPDRPSPDRMVALGALVTLNGTDSSGPTLTLERVRENIDSYYALARKAATTPRRERMDLHVLSAARERAGERSKLLAVILPDASRIIKAVDQGELDVNAVRVIVALARYHARTGSYPEHLTDLVPRELAAAPDDAIAAWPLTYKKSGKGYKLYSVGLDGVDDDGKTDPNNPFKALTPEGAGLDCAFNR